MRNRRAASRTLMRMAEGAKAPRRLAAVVIPIFANPPHEVVFVERARHLRRNAGQIAFPGGAVDDELAKMKAEVGSGAPPQQAIEAAPAEDAAAPAPAAAVPAAAAPAPPEAPAAPAAS